MTGPRDLAPEVARLTTALAALLRIRNAADTAAEAATEATTVLELHVILGELIVVIDSVT